MANLSFTILSMRAENLRKCLKYEELQILGELAKSYITSSNIHELVLQGRFSAHSVSNVLNQLGIEDGFEIPRLPHSMVTIIRFE